MFVGQVATACSANRPQQRFGPRPHGGECDASRAPVGYHRLGNPGI